MEELVFLEPNSLKSEPFTTSEVIAEYAEISHHAIQQMISKHEDSLKQFGVFAFEMRKPPEGSKGGRPETIYHLNEGQATLLITFLKNTKPVVKFKVELVRQFYLMRDELMKRRIYREELKPIRRELTDVIQENPEHGQWDYKLYTDLAYKTVTGKTAAQLRKERGAPKKARAIEFMTSEEIASITKLEEKLAVLVEMGMNYEQVKAILSNRKTLAGSKTA